MVSSGNANKEKVRVGLLIDSFAQPRWIHQVVQDIQSSSVAAVALIVKNEAKADEKRFRIQRYWQNRNHLLYAAYTRFDEAMTRTEPDAFESADIEPLVRDCPVIGVEPLMKKHTDRFRDEDVEEISGIGSTWRYASASASSKGGPSRSPGTGCGRTTTATARSTAAGPRASGR